jgi:prepilin-type N-terminal cleavage/methylation domain-containing protein
MPSAFIRECQYTLIGCVKQKQNLLTKIDPNGNTLIGKITDFTHSVFPFCSIPQFTQRDRTMHFNDRDRQLGFSIIEVLLVVIVMGILTTFALLQLRGAKTDVERQNIVRELKNYLERARFDSVKRRADADAEMATIRLIGPTSFSAAIDFDQSGSLLPAETRTMDFGERSNTRVSIVDTLSYPVTIRFNRRGQATAVDSTNTVVTPVFRICSNCSAATPNISYISISASGTISDSSAAPGVLPTPAVNANANASLNCYVLVTNTNSNCRMF